ncbi:MazG nucleotide pyrophosphohydrolase domain-containing protein [Legionella jordanis]|uniref:Nucleoside triphosphate pyrophosphohydrolase MazG n=1 Tax=Legionella jordanis TaxID=456 RepID=A0A0W0VDC7_9GAMM|nr:MazG nucleotide pyrophosphohydrolase domain-containing protein [Legionella jordanis]KTD18110.1 nucleoside triphosphate pyrophosphohydrolase MazG [Legionella jordanis]VEH13797.1 nucleoside triphosphate pyrophosphohydrolase MazG [Legionella jordanis]
MTSIQMVSNAVAQEFFEKLMPNASDSDVKTHNISGLNGDSNVHLAAIIDDRTVGILSLSFPYPLSAKIDCLEIVKPYQSEGLENLLLQKAEQYAKKKASMITVQILAAEAGPEALRRFNFYCNQQFSPLINLIPECSHPPMVCMIKRLDNAMDELIALEQEARSFGFEWPNEEMILDQALSECAEIKEALENGESQKRIQEEMGDLLHTAISLCLFAGFHPEDTMAKIASKFKARMQALKEDAYQNGLKHLKGQPPSMLMKLWQEAKKKSK